MFKHGLDPGINLWLQRLILGLQINKRDVHLLSRFGFVQRNPQVAQEFAQLYLPVLQKGRVTCSPCSDM